MTPRGFLFSAVEAAIKKPGRTDMALIYSESEAVVSGVFTTNRVKAAPVILDMQRIKSGKGRAVVINSGNANACTGGIGMKNAEETAKLAAFYLNIPGDSVYVSSTGVIGVRLPMQRIKDGVKGLVSALGKATPEDAARAIMTTDTFPKLSFRKVKANGKEGIVLGFCKGAGMIRPKMATMLCYILTDIAVTQGALRTALKDAVEESFNRIVIEGDMSTNDTVLAFANGALGNKPLTGKSTRYKQFKKALLDVSCELSRMIVKDGEGATKLIEIEVKGAATKADAEKAAYAVANSFLVKTAIYGSDPNWGRIMASVGYSGIKMEEDRTAISIGGVKVARKGISTGKEKEAAGSLKQKEIEIIIDLGIGKGRAKVITSDITEEMVRLNSEYTT